MSVKCSDNVVSQQKSARPPPINVEKPKFPQYAAYAKRMESFESWPEYIPVKKDDLVEAGLVYTGVGDTVRCYSCGGGLKDWEQYDVPMEEHGKWYPKCPHVMLVKGQAYIERLQRGEKPEEPLPAQTNSACTARNHLVSLAARSFISLGYSKEMVQKAIDIFIDRHDISEFTSIQFAEILFDLEEGVEQFTQGNHYFPTGHLYKIMDELQGSGPFLDSRNHNQTRKEEYESKLTVPSWALDMVKQLTSVIDDTLKTATGVLSFLAKRCPYLFPDLTREPTEKDLFTFAEAIGNNFKQLGHALGVSASKLDRISMDNETSLMKIYSMLKEWQSSNPLTASLESLVKTMKTCKSVTVDWDKIGKACF